MLSILVYLFTKVNYFLSILHYYSFLLIQIFTNFIQRMRNLREDHDKTQQNIADILGTSQTMYARYERGANELPIHHLITLCDYYHVSADYFLGLSDHPGFPKKPSLTGNCNRKLC